jgi:hypothetical protein
VFKRIFWMGTGVAVGAAARSGPSGRSSRRSSSTSPTRSPNGQPPRLATLAAASVRRLPRAGRRCEPPRPNCAPGWRPGPSSAPLLRSPRAVPVAPSPTTASAEWPPSLAAAVARALRRAPGPKAAAAPDAELTLVPSGGSAGDRPPSGRPVGTRPTKSHDGTGLVVADGQCGRSHHGPAGRVGRRRHCPSPTAEHPRK